MCGCCSGPHLVVNQEINRHKMYFHEAGLEISQSKVRMGSRQQNEVDKSIYVESDRGRMKSLRIYIRSESLTGHHTHSGNNAWDHLGSRVGVTRLPFEQRDQGVRTTEVIARAAAGNSESPVAAVINLLQSGHRRMEAVYGFLEL